MTKKDLEKMRDKITENLSHPSFDHPFDSHFDRGFDAAVEILWPRLVGLSDGIRGFYNCDFQKHASSIFIPSENMRKALKEHGVTDE